LTDPQTRRPRTVSLTLDIEIGNGVESQHQVETHDWTSSGQHRDVAGRTLG
jgi:hypothetical protein